MAPGMPFVVAIFALLGVGSLAMVWTMETESLLGKATFSFFIIAIDVLFVLAMFAEGGKP